MRYCSAFFLVLLLGFAFGDASLKAEEKAPHPFYVSVGRVAHDGDSESIQITFKIFTDDLTRALERKGAQDLRLGTREENKKAGTYIHRYLQQEFSLRVNGKEKKLAFVGKEVEVNATWCYLEVKDIPEVRELAFDCTLLTEVYDDQSNIIHTEVNGQKKSARLNKERTTESFRYGVPEGD